LPLDGSFTEKFPSEVNYRFAQYQINSDIGGIKLSYCEVILSFANNCAGPSRVQTPTRTHGGKIWQFFSGRTDNFFTQSAGVDVAV
jgi:hypothetical protein